MDGRKDSACAKKHCCDGKESRIGLTGPHPLRVLPIVQPDVLARRRQRQQEFTSELADQEQGCHASGRPRPRPADVRTRPTIPRTSALAAVRLQPGPSSKAVRRRRTAAPSAGGRPQLPFTGSRPPAPSALYDSNFSFLHYVFVSLIAVT
jgi:hypothetical protein